MAVIKRKTRKKLSKQLTKIVKKHGPALTLALVSGIVSGLSSEEAKKPRKGKSLPVEPPLVKTQVRSGALRKRPTL